MFKILHIPTGKIVCWSENGEHFWPNTKSATQPRYHEVYPKETRAPWGNRGLTEVLAFSNNSNIFWDTREAAQDLLTQVHMFNLPVDRPGRTLYSIDEFEIIEI